MTRFWALWACARAAPRGVGALELIPAGCRRGLAGAARRDGGAKYEVNAVPVMDVVRGLKHRAEVRRAALSAKRGTKGRGGGGGGAGAGEAGVDGRTRGGPLERVPAKAMDETVNVQVLTTLDPRMGDQQLRASVVLPHRVGKEVRVVAFVTSEVEREAAVRAGAVDYGNLATVVAMVKAGRIPFTKAVATPEALREVGPSLGRVLGPKGLMPSVKLGTVDKDIAAAVRKLVAGSSVVVRASKAGEVCGGVGKVGMSAEKIAENLIAFVKAVFDHKPEKIKKRDLVKAVWCGTTQSKIAVKVSLESMAPFGFDVN